MRERTTWSREIIASKLRKVAEDPRSMNQDHIERQPAADAYVLGDGSPSQFAEDVNSGKGSWKSEQGSDGNTKRNEIGFPDFRGDTFNNPESSPGVSPSRQAALSVDEVHARAELATKAARIMLPKTASERAIEDQALLLMDLPTSSLKSTLSRLAQEDEGDDDEDEDDDEGQGKQAQQDDDEEKEDGQQAKQAKDLPPEFLKNIQEKKDQAKDDKGEKKDEKKEARSRRAQDQDEKKQSQQQDKEEQQGKEARARKAQQQDEDEGEDAGQDKEAADQDQDEKKQSQQQDQDKEACGQVGKEAAALIKQAAAGLLSVPQTSRHAAFKAMLPMLMKSASQGLGQPVAQQQLQSQVQQLVQQAMQQQLADQQQQQVAQGQQQQVAQGQEQLPQLAQGQQQLQPLGQDDSQALVDQLFQEPDQGQQFFASADIQMESPTMDIGDVSFGPEDAALNTLFASEPEVQRAIQANALRSGTAAPTPTRTASTRTVGTRPTEGVSHLGGAVSSTPGGSSEEINRLSGMWSTAPDVSGVFSS